MRWSVKTLSFSGLIIILIGFLLSAETWIVEQLQLSAMTGPYFTCASPNVITAGSCRRAEEKILKSTVRIRVETWVVEENEKGYFVDVSVGHATVKDGQYLVTHNHFPIPLSILQQEGEPGVYSVVFLYDTQGRLVHKTPLTDFEVFQQKDESLVFAHKESDFLSELGFESAEFMDGRLVPGRAGMEVAQIDWDGQTSRVDWTTVQEMRLVGETPILVLDDGALPGASGGGIFWNGFHVANNWHVEERLAATGEVVGTTTIVALNTVPDLRPD